MLVCSKPSRIMATNRSKKKRGTNRKYAMKNIIPAGPEPHPLVYLPFIT